LNLYKRLAALREARLLTDFYLQEGRSVAAFDLNSGEGTLAQFLPEHATTAGIGDIKGQMALFDRLIADDDTTKIVDLGHESFESFFVLANQIGFAEEARKRAIAPAILFVLTPDRTSIEVADCAAVFRRRCWRRCTTKSLGAQHRDKYELMGGEVVVRLPVLALVLRNTSRRRRSRSRIMADRRLRCSVRGEYRMQRWLRMSLGSGTRPAHSAVRPAILNPATLCCALRFHDVNKSPKNRISFREPRNQNQRGAFPSLDFPRAIPRKRGGTAMWISLFSVVTAISLGFGLAAWSSTAGARRKRSNQ
jgi:hypothetical protein